MSWQYPPPSESGAVVIVRDVSSGKIHKRFRVPGKSDLMSYEADNADEAGDAVEITEAELADVPHDARCRRCFGDEGAG